MSDKDWNERINKFAGKYEEYGTKLHEYTEGKMSVASDTKVISMAKKGYPMAIEEADRRGLRY